MKAKIIKTEEMVEVYHEPQHGQTSNIYKEAVLLNGRMWTEDELDFSMNLDLEKHLKEDIEDVFFDLDGVAVKGATHYLTVEDVKDIAKHFYELGIKATQKGE